LKLRDLGNKPAIEWFQQILEWSRKKLTFDDNIDCVIITAYIGASETEVGHPLGRTPRYIIPVASYPNGTDGISFTKEPTHEKLFLSRANAGVQTLILT
jgi:hypothetical protein